MTDSLRYFFDHWDLYCDLRLTGEIPSINKLTFNIFSYPHYFIVSLPAGFLALVHPGALFCCQGQGLMTARAHWQFPSLVVTASAKRSAARLPFPSRENR